MNDNKSTVMNNAAVQQLRKVPGFDPMKLLRKTISVKTGHPVWKLDLRYKRLWFRLACPNGRMLLKPLRISDQLAIIEAQVYFSKDDPVPAASFTSEQRRENVPSGEFLRAAQEHALNMALENAGFGIQFCDVSRDYGGELFGSEAPIQTEVAEAAVEETKALIAEETAAETAPTMDMDSAPTEQHVAETTVSDVQNVTDGFTSVAVDVRQEQSVSAAQEEVPDLHVLPPQQEEAAEEVAEQPQAASYTTDMDVSEITQRMTVDEAKAVVVQIGTCRGWTLEQVAQRRPASLKWGTSMAAIRRTTFSKPLHLFCWTICSRKPDEASSLDERVWPLSKPVLRSFRSTLQTLQRCCGSISADAARTFCMWTARFAAIIAESSI